MLNVVSKTNLEAFLVRFNPFSNFNKLLKIVYTLAIRYLLVSTATPERTFSTLN